MNTAYATRIRLNVENVQHIFNRCLYTPECSCSTEPLTVQGYNSDFVFNPDMLQLEKSNIEELLKQLPENFKEGWSFWEMYRTQDGYNWTNAAKNMEALMVLGIAIKKIRYVLPKNLWWSLPGGAPYVVINQ